jgi:hypothetical protein
MGISRSRENVLAIVFLSACLCFSPPAHAQMTLQGIIDQEIDKQVQECQAGIQQLCFGLALVGRIDASGRSTFSAMGADERIFSIARPAREVYKEMTLQARQAAGVSLSAGGPCQRVRTAGGQFVNSPLPLLARLY